MKRLFTTLALLLTLLGVHASVTICGKHIVSNVELTSADGIGINSGSITVDTSNKVIVLDHVLFISTNESPCIAITNESIPWTLRVVGKNDFYEYYENIISVSKTTLDIVGNNLDDKLMLKNMFDDGNHTSDSGDVFYLDKATVNIKNIRLEAYSFYRYAMNLNNSDVLLTDVEGFLQSHSSLPTIISRGTSSLSLKETFYPSDTYKWNHTTGCIEDNGTPVKGKVTLSCLEYGIEVCGVSVTKHNRKDVLGDGKVMYLDTSQQLYIDSNTHLKATGKTPAIRITKDFTQPFHLVHEDNCIIEAEAECVRMEADVDFDIFTPHSEQTLTFLSTNGDCICLDNERDLKLSSYKCVFDAKNFGIRKISGKAGSLIFEGTNIDMKCGEGTIMGFQDFVFDNSYCSDALYRDLYMVDAKGNHAKTTTIRSGYGFRYKGINIDKYNYKKLEDEDMEYDDDKHTINLFRCNITSNDAHALEILNAEDMTLMVYGYCSISCTSSDPTSYFSNIINQSIGNFSIFNDKEFLYAAELTLSNTTIGTALQSLKGGTITLRNIDLNIAAKDEEATGIWCDNIVIDNCNVSVDCGGLAFDAKNHKLLNCRFVKPENANFTSNGELIEENGNYVHYMEISRNAYNIGINVDVNGEGGANGKFVTYENCSDIMGDGGSVSYDPITNVLTLNNANLYNIFINYSFIFTKQLPRVKDNFTIVLKGDNVIETHLAVYYTEWAIKGEGKLTIHNPLEKSTHVIYSDGSSNLTIEDCTLDLRGQYAVFNSPMLTFKNAVVYAKAPEMVFAGCEINLIDCEIVKPENIDYKSEYWYLKVKDLVILPTSTSVQGVTISDDDEPAYNLQGQRVGDNYRGVVVKKGKKMIVK